MADSFPSLATVAATRAMAITAATEAAVTVGVAMVVAAAAIEAERASA
jgi:hypothetical protein